MRRTFTLIITPLLLAAASAWTLRAARLDQRQQMEDAWTAVRLVKQTVHVSLSQAKGRYAGTFELKAERAVENVVFAFPLSPDGSGKEAATVTCEDTALEAVPFMKDTYATGRDRFRSRATNRGHDNEQRQRVRQIRSALDTMFGYRSYGDPEVIWQAHELDLAGNKTCTIRVEATMPSFALADSATHGPCRAFRIPLRLGAMWARPAGVLEAVVELDNDIDPARAVMIRPPGAKRDGRTLSLTCDGEDPLEDLIVVITNERPGAPSSP